ncbi:phospholipase D-like domain-containing protein [Flavobacterium sp.]|uniref:phospholipase D-like domain-containing protein n=1 Tax=Flavobacterium sp. TaxID=239 RepID=UPI003BD6A5C2
MIRYFPLSILIFFLFIIFPGFAQETSTEKDFTVHYFPTKLELNFDNGKLPSYIKLTDAFSNIEVPLEKTNTPNLFVINSVKPSQFFRIDYTLSNQKEMVHSSTTIASKSASSGLINVYFNHTVDATFSQTQNAVNLSNTLDNMLISYINNCIATLDIAIYNSYSPSATTGIAGAINAAFARGVQVRIIYDGSTSSSMLPLLNSAIPMVASPTTSSGIMHNKFVIIDAICNNPFLSYVWTGSTNWTTAQIDGPDRNNAIVIQDQTLAGAYTLEFEEMWGSSSATPNTTISKFGQYKTNNTPHNFIIGGKIVESYFSPSDGTTSKIISAINSAISDIEIAVMNFTRTDISSALLNKYNSGFTNINVLLDSSNPLGNQITTLQAGLLPNHALVDSASGIMHHKFMVIDNFNSNSDPLVLTGSHNWSTAAETKNDENTLIVHDANIANQYFQAFAPLYQASGGTINLPLSNIDNNNNGSLIKIIPNPNSGIFEVISSENLNDIEIRLYDILGKLIYENQYSLFSNCSIDMSSNKSGFYSMDVNYGEKSNHFKIVKK